MNLKKTEIKFSTIKEEELFISGKDLAALLKATLAKDSYFRFKVKGFSMSPFIKDNDVVTVSPLLDSKIDFGRTVAFVHPKTERLAIHRIVDKIGDYYLIKGDCVFNADGLIPRENILGVVTKIERRCRKIFLGLGFERIIIALLSQARFLSFIFWIWRLVKFLFKRPVL